MKGRAPSVVFVDDEATLMECIRDYVSGEHPDWEAFYFTNPVDALEFVRRHGAELDAIVCDIHMPYASGIEILDLIRTDHPDIVRITLSGHLDIKTIVGAGRSADLNICKPVRVGLLCETIMRSLSERQRVDGP